MPRHQGYSDGDFGLSVSEVLERLGCVATREDLSP